MSSLDTEIKDALGIILGMANNFTIWILPMRIRPLHLYVVFIWKFKKLIRRRLTQRRLKKKWINISPTNLGIFSSHLLCLSLSQLSRNWIWDTAINLKYNFNILPVVVHVLQTTQNWSISCCCFAEDGKGSVQRFIAHQLRSQGLFLGQGKGPGNEVDNARAEPLFCSLNLLFSDVPVADDVISGFLKLDVEDSSS